MYTDEELLKFIVKGNICLSAMDGAVFIATITTALAASKDTKLISPYDMKNICIKAMDFYKAIENKPRGQVYEETFTKYIPELNEFLNNIIKEKK